MLKGRTLDHIGIATNDVKGDVKFYLDVMGFRIIAQYGDCYFLQNGATTIEIYQVNDLPADACGKVDHIAYVSGDIEKDYQFAVEAGYEVCTDGIEDIEQFWSNGIRYFKLRTPGGQQVEFNQIL